MTTTNDDLFCFDLSGDMGNKPAPAAERMTERPPHDDSTVYLSGWMANVAARQRAQRELTRTKANARRVHQAMRAAIRKHLRGVDRVIAYRNTAKRHAALMFELACQG